MNSVHSRWNGLAVICIIGFITIASVAAKIAAPFLHVTADNDLNTIISGGMLGLLGLLKSAQTMPNESPAGTDADPVKTEITNSPANAVKTEEVTP